MASAERRRADTVEAIAAILEGLAPIRALEAKLSGVLQARARARARARVRFEGEG